MILGMISGILMMAAIFATDDFSTVGNFAENWVVTNPVRSENGACRFFGGSIAWRGNLPTEFTAEVDVTLSPSWTAHPASAQSKAECGDWGGFMFGGQRFQIRSNGTTFIIAHGGTVYKPLLGYAPGKKQHLKLIKRLEGGAVKMEFFVNGTRFFSAFDDDPPNGPLTLMAYGIDMEADDFSLSSVVRDNASPNLIINSGFEHDLEGVPDYFQFLGNFNWKRPVDEYEDVYLKRIAVDREVKHSGKQSLRLTLSPACTWESVKPCRVGVAPGVAGTMSVYLKTDVPGGVTVKFELGGKREEKHVEGDWTRHTFTVDKLPKPGRYPCAYFSVPNPNGQRGNLWFDDFQVELAAEASAYRASELDRERFNGYKAEIPAWRKNIQADNKNETWNRRVPGVVGRLDYYMDEAEVAWRITDDNLNVTEVRKPMGEIPYGTNVIEFAVHGKTYKEKVVRLPFKKGAVQVNRWSRCLMRDSKPFLFSGICLDPIGDPYDPKGLKFAPMFELLAAKGFKFYQSLSSDRHPELNKICFDEGEKRGLLHLCWWNNAPTPPGEKVTWHAKTIEEYYPWYDRANIISQMILDEPELAQSSEWGEKRLEFTKKFYPYTPVQMNNSITGIPRNYAALKTDVFMLDDYLTNQEGRDVYTVVGCVDQMWNADPGKPCWFFVVGDNMTLHYRNPTAAEQVAQSWGCICAGCSGISWYIGFPHTEPTWRAIVQLNREFQELAPAILSEELCKPVRCTEPRQSIVHKTTVYNGAGYLFTVNIDRKAKERVGFNLSEDFPEEGEAEVLFENRTIRYSKCRLVDSYEPHARHVYRIGKRVFPRVNLTTVVKPREGRAPSRPRPRQSAALPCGNGDFATASTTKTEKEIQ